MTKKKTIILLVLTAFVITGLILTNMFFNSKKSNKELDLGTEEVKFTNLPEAKLTFYFLSQDKKDARAVLDQVEAMAQKSLNIKLDFKYFWEYPESYLKSVKEIIASGQPCDAFFYMDELPQSLQALADENVIKDLSDILPQYAPRYFSKFSKEEVAAVSAKRKIYAIPRKFPTTQMKCAVVREDLMKMYNIPDIRNYDDYEVFLKTIKEKEPEMVPFNYYEASIGLFAEANGYVVFDYRMGLVYKWDDPSMKILAWEQTPEYSKCIETIDGWYKNGYMLKNAPVNEIDSRIVTSGKWASLISNLGEAANYNAILERQNIDWRYKEYPLYLDKISARSAPTYSLVVNAASSNAERVIMFTEWLYSKQEYYDSFMYGINGKHYSIENNNIKLTAGNSFDCPWGYVFVNMDNDRVPGSNTEAAKKELLKTLNTKTKYPPHTGFRPDYSLVSGMVASRQFAFNKLEEKIYSGGYTREDLQAYIEKEKNSGIANFISEIQRQLSKWKSEN